MVLLFVILLQAEPLDEVSLKKLLLQFEKRLYRNQELRVKFPDMPEKYVSVAVIESLKSMYAACV